MDKKELKSDHTHRSEEGEPVACSKPKLECDLWHHHAFERMKEYEADHPDEFYAEVEL